MTTPTPVLSGSALTTRQRKVILVVLVVLATAVAILLPQMPALEDPGPAEGRAQAGVERVTEGSVGG